MLIHINTNGKYELAKVLEIIPKLVQLPSGHKCHTYIRFQKLKSKKVDNTLFIDNVNWHPVNMEQFKKKCYSLKLPFFNYSGIFEGFKPK